LALCRNNQKRLKRWERDEGVSGHRIKDIDNQLHSQRVGETSGKEYAKWRRKPELEHGQKKVKQERRWWL
jgi:hypothetical protein